MTTEEKGNIRIDVPSGSLAAEGSPPGTEIDGSQGIFELRDANDLLAKLERDFVAFEAQPWNSDLAFNFFVTGWSLLEWYYPNDTPKRNAIRNGSVPLQVCHYIATGAKHFDPRDPIHESVTATVRRNAPEELTGGKWASGAWADGAWESSLTISLRPSPNSTAKLERDFVAFEAQPWNSDLAFNFFVTGWSLLEWYYPNDTPKRNAIRNGSVPLQVCHYIATGAKHFDPRDPIHESVTATVRRNAPEELTGGKWASGAWADGAWESSLTISLRPTAEAHFGESKVPAVRVAAEVLEFWRGHTR